MDMGARQATTIDSYEGWRGLEIGVGNEIIEGKVREVDGVGEEDAFL
jgi:hypothetical protein